ncbi:MAG: hypothetical protein L7F78_20990, partial [Syntrophales bacterium LBB04]|nr:hypothetical protein [Syntrophales bacterium LBB04]
MNYFGDRLSKAQQLALYGGGAVVLVLLLLQFLFFPIIHAKQSMNEAIRSSERTLREMRLLVTEYRGLKQNADKIQQVVALNTVTIGALPVALLLLQKGLFDFTGLLLDIESSETTAIFVCREKIVEVRSYAFRAVGAGQEEGGEGGRLKLCQ